MGVLWDRDPRLARPLITKLREDRSCVVGDNEPYSGALPHDTLWRHASARGLAHALLEIRQDLVAEDAQAETWAQRLATVLRACRAEASLNTIKHYGGVSAD